MMSQYLRNLIARHQPEAVRPGATGFVHPRLASRFEEQPMDPPVPGPTITEPASADVPGPVAPVRDKPTRSDRPAGPDSNGSPEARRPPEPSSTHRVIRAEQPEPDHAAIVQPGALPRDPGGPPRRGGTAAEPAGKQLRSRGRQREKVQDDPQGRTVRREANVRSAGRQPLGDSRDQLPGSRELSAAGDAVEPVPTAAHAPAHADPPAPVSRQRPAVTMQDPENGRRSEEREPPGALQTPEWAAEVQAMLRERQGAPRPPAESEPTVSVTIGRIDIRAVRKENRQRTGQVTAPSRIMSLDDYLKKRDGRQR